MLVTLRIPALLLLFTDPAFGFCPQNCNCDNEHQLTVNCDNVKLRYLPPLLHPGTQTLRLSNCQIEHLDPDVMELYPDLLHLDLSFNDISSLENNVFRYQGKLRQLNLSNNSISTIHCNSFQGLHALQNLNLSSSEVQYIEPHALEHLSNLLELDLSHNLLRNLTSETFAGLDNLQSLMTARNRITDLDGQLFRTLPSLRYIDLSQNLITTISSDVFNHLKLVETVDLSANSIAEIPILGRDDLPNLKHLNVGYNKLNKIEPYSFRQLPSLLELNLSGNEFMELPASAFDGLFRLKILTLSEQKYLKTIQSGAFAGLASLEVLNLSFSHALENIDQEAFEISHTLRIFDASFCALRTLPLTLLDWKKVPELCLGGNLFHCDQMLLAFLPNVLRLRSINNVVCSTPDELFNVSISSLDIVEVTPEDTKQALIIVSVAFIVFTVTAVLALFLYSKITQPRCSERKSRAPIDEQRLYRNLLHKSEYIHPESYNSANEFSSSSTCATQNTIVNLFRSKSYNERPCRIPTDAVLFSDDCFVQQADFTYLSAT